MCHPPAATYVWHLLSIERIRHCIRTCGMFRQSACNVAFRCRCVQMDSDRVKKPYTALFTLTGSRQTNRVRSRIILLNLSGITMGCKEWNKCWSQNSINVMLCSESAINCDTCNKCVMEKGNATSYHYAPTSSSIHLPNTISYVDT